uniref:Uncharacterized protein n=1 Tax=Arundo donax TaxID=35708 RepID=A0A0A8ZBV8_ARUDO
MVSGSSTTLSRSLGARRARKERGSGCLVDPHTTHLTLRCFGVVSTQMAKDRLPVGRSSPNVGGNQIVHTGIATTWMNYRSMKRVINDTNC